MLEEIKINYIKALKLVILFIKVAPVVVKEEDPFENFENTSTNYNENATAASADESDYAMRHTSEIGVKVEM